MELLDLRPCERELEDLRAAAAGPAADAPALLPRARALVVRLRAAPALAGTGAAVAAADRPWQALRMEENGRGQVCCWRAAEAGGDELALTAAWDGAALESLVVTAGERGWGAHRGPLGEATLEAGKLLEVAADGERLADLARRVRERHRDWERATAAPPWRCPRCAWPNEEERAACALCGAPRRSEEGAAMSLPIAPRFAEVERHYRFWMSELAAGRITPAQVDAGLEAAMIEHGGRWWMLGASSGRWYVHDGQQWVEADPPPGGAPPVAPAPVVAPAPAATAAAGGVPAAPALHAAPAASPSARTPLAAAPKALFGCLSLLALLAFAAGAALTVRSLLTGRGHSELPTTLLVVGAFLFAFALGALLPRLLSALLLGAGVVWTAAALVALNTDFARGGDFWWAPDAAFATGLAALVGGILGLLVWPLLRPRATATAGGG